MSLGHMLKKINYFFFFTKQYQILKSPYPVTFLQSST